MNECLAIDRELKRSHVEDNVKVDVDVRPVNNRTTRLRNKISKVYQRASFQHTAARLKMLSGTSSDSISGSLLVTRAVVGSCAGAPA